MIAPLVSRRLSLIAVTAACAACGQSAHTTTRTAAPVPRTPRCPLPLISGGLPATYLQQSTVIGPVAIYPARSEYPNLRADTFAPVSGHAAAARYSSIDAAVTVSALGRVTVSIPRGQQDHARLLFDRTRFGNAGYRLSDGSPSYTFIGCRSPYTQYQGGFIITEPGCVDLQVRTAGTSPVERGRLQFGTRGCASR